MKLALVLQASTFVLYRIYYLERSQSFSEFLANQSEDNSVYMSFQSALFHIEARKGIFNSNSQALRA